VTAAITYGSSGTLLSQELSPSSDNHPGGTEQVIGQSFKLTEHVKVTSVDLTLALTSAAYSQGHTLVLWTMDPDTYQLVELQDTYTATLAADFTKAVKTYDATDSPLLPPGYYALLVTAPITGTLAIYKSTANPYHYGERLSANYRYAGSTMTPTAADDLYFVLTGSDAAVSDGAVHLGNGILAGPSARDSVRISDHSGFDGPEYAVGVVEGSSTDGGRITGSRSKSRRPVVKLTFPSSYTRSAIAALFPPRTERVLWTSRGWLPYYVEGLNFTSPRLRGAQTVVVSMVSGEAYAASARLSDSISGPDVVDSESEVAVPVRMTVTLPADTNGVTLRTANGITVVSTAMTTGQVLVVDSEEHTVTLNGTDALSAFSESYEWPKLGAGESGVVAYTALGVSCSVVLEWTPKRLGLF
jgi:hypothetical protein